MTSIIGIDRSPKAIAMAKERARQHGFQQADFSVSSVEDFSPTEPFDMVIGRYVLRQWDRR
jgi:2-polyprenyl-3-methyl-5-hydroxy-6-metoxy-1,4-benzoquinol methylase